MTAAQLQHCCALPRASEKPLQQSVERLALSGRGIHWLLALGRAIADLAGSEIIEPAHLAEAVPPRPPLKSAYCANDTM
jgi:magnesium chelatase family protein